MEVLVEEVMVMVKVEVEVLEEEAMVTVEMGVA